MPLLDSDLGVHLHELHVAFARLSLGGLDIDRGDKVTSLGDILLDVFPRLSDLVVPMMFG